MLIISFDYSVYRAACGTIKPRKGAAPCESLKQNNESAETILKGGKNGLIKKRT